MIYVGIDVAKSKHDCFICNSDGDVLFKSFTIQNNREGYDLLLERIRSLTDDFSKVRVGLEATGHYSYNILDFLLKNKLPTYVINPLQAKSYKKGKSLRKTKTDKVDAQAIASMIKSEDELRLYSTDHHLYEELKSLCRYRLEKSQERATLKTSISRLVCILFPELEDLVCTLHLASIYAMLFKFPGATYIASSSISELTEILSINSKFHFGEDTALHFHDAATNSIGATMPAKSLELKHTIKLIYELNSEIEEIDRNIKTIMDTINSPILTIPGIGYTLGATIIAEIGDFNRFDSPDKILAFAGMAPSTYQSGQLDNCHAHMEKRGSRFLRSALYNATKLVCTLDPSFKSYLEKKRAEGKHYSVAIPHATKKLVRIIYAMEKSQQPYNPNHQNIK